MQDIIEILKSKDNKGSYDFVVQLCNESNDSNKYYSLFDAFVFLLDSECSYIRTRGFILCCAQAKWDKQNKIEKNLDSLLKLLHDEKPTVVRQCIANIKKVVVVKPELKDRIVKELQSIDLSKYKDSMSPLIKKDIEQF